MRNRKFVAIAGLALSALVLSACSSGTTEAPSGPTGEDSGDATGGEASPDGEEKVHVIVFGGLGAEGALASNAATSVTSAEASVAAINAAGGILGKQVEIEVLDDTADPTVAVTKLRERLAKGEPIVASMNSGPSTVADATIPILMQEEILSFNIGPTADSANPEVFPYNFDLSPTAADYIKGFLPVMEENGYEKVAILNGADPYGDNFAASAAEIFSAEGFDVTGTRSFDNASLDMTAQLDALKATDPDVLILDAYGSPVVYVLEGIEKLGWDIPIMANNSVSASPASSTEPPTGLLGTDRVKNLRMQVFASTVYDPSNTEVADAVDLMVETGPIKSTLINAYNYDSMWLLKAAAEDAGSFDAAALTASLEKPEVQQAAQTVIIKQYNFSATSHSPVPNPDEFRFISPGPLVNGQFQ